MLSSGRFQARLLKLPGCWNDFNFQADTRCKFARVVKGVDLRSTAGNCAWARAPQLTANAPMMARVALLPPPAYPVCTARGRWMSHRSSVAEVVVICRWTARSGLLPQARPLHASFAASHI